MPDGFEGLHVELQLVAVDGAGVAGEAAHLVGVELDVLAAKRSHGTVVFPVAIVKEGCEIGDGIGVLVDKDVLGGVALDVGALCVGHMIVVFAGQTVAGHDKVLPAAVDFNLGVLGVDTLGIDKMVGIFCQLDGLGLSREGCDGCHEEQ